MGKERKIDMVILGLLSHEDLSGYDIKKRIYLFICKCSIRAKIIYCHFTCIHIKTFLCHLYLLASKIIS